MVRTAAAIVVGYAATVLFVMLTFTLLWLALGQDRAFHPGTTNVTGAWLAGSMLLNVVAAMLGGWVAARVGADRPHVAVTGLVVVILLLGFTGAMTAAVSFQGDAPPLPPPPADMGPAEAARAAIQPLWVAWTLPIIGAVGAWAGGSLRMLQASRTRH